jgi:hypothetical protein
VYLNIILHAFWHHVSLQQQFSYFSSLTLILHFLFVVTKQSLPFSVILFFSHPIFPFDSTTNFVTSAAGPADWLMA